MKKIVLSIIVITNIVFAQCNIEWFPKGLNVQPFTANILEARAGFNFMLDRNNLRLDIGTSQDLMNVTDGNSSYSFGADVFTYTRLSSTDDFHFPVETIDYLFGINGTYKRKIENSFVTEVGARLRISHISAHLVDGRFDYSKYDWRDGRRSQVYSREFIELLPYVRVSDIRFYAGFSYLLHTTPKEFGKVLLQAGSDYFYKCDKLPFSPFAAYDFKLAKIKEYSPNHSLEVGIKFGKPFEKGFSIYYSYNSGKSIHGELYEMNESYSGLGFNLDI